jgi:hypothetical protein
MQCRGRHAIHDNPYPESRLPICSRDLPALIPALWLLHVDWLIRIGSISSKLGRSLHATLF